MLRSDLYSFVQAAFPIVAAEQALLRNWHVEAMTYALTRVLRGEIKRLIITVPPRSLKSPSARQLRCQPLLWVTIRHANLFV